MKKHVYEKRLKDLTCLYDKSFKLIKLNIWGIRKLRKKNYSVNMAK